MIQNKKEPPCTWLFMLLGGVFFPLLMLINVFLMGTGSAISKFIFKCVHWPLVLPADYLLDLLGYSHRIEDSLGASILLMFLYWIFMGGLLGFSLARLIGFFRLRSKDR
jgi:hypothetical protein